MANLCFTDSVALFRIFSTTLKGTTLVMEKLPPDSIYSFQTFFHKEQASKYKKDKEKQSFLIFDKCKSRF